MTTPLELLAPAGNAVIGKAAIACGADAVYIGGPAFGARAAAGNTIEDITGLIEYAHLFAAKVYVALNTILSDEELPCAIELIDQVHAAGADGLIIQDLGLLEHQLPPIALIASTQMHSTTAEKVKFLEQVGFKRVILERALSLAEIGAIRSQTSVELECFVHGALCVAYSGQCYLSQALTGRSGNRGVCAQPCRHSYSLRDGEGRTVVRNKYLLSLKDLNLSGSIPALVEAGITSFKIEGRYKDAAYVKNVVAAFSEEIDRFIADTPGYRRASVGKAELDFTPDLHRTFNRGYTRFFIDDRTERVGAPDTPKSLGKPVGTVARLGDGFFTLRGEQVVNGDGLCFFNAAGVLSGFRVNRVEGERVYAYGEGRDPLAGLKVGDRMFRNFDQAFLRQLERSPARRRVAVRLHFRWSGDQIVLTAEDEEGNRAEAAVATPYVPPRDPAAVRERTIAQLASLGNTIYRLEGLTIEPAESGFLAVSTLNGLRREALEALTKARLACHRPMPVVVSAKEVPYPQQNVDYRANVLNRDAARFYARHGATVDEPALEAGGDIAGRTLLITRYCIRHELGACSQFDKNAVPLKEPLCLSDGRRKYRLKFDCRHCLMSVIDDS